MKKFLEEHGESVFYMILGLVLTGFFGTVILALTMY